MKITKGRLKQLIKEEVNKIVLKETSQYIWKAFEKVNKEVGSEQFLREMFEDMSDSESLQKVKSIAQKHGIDLTNDSGGQDQQVQGNEQEQIKEELK